MNRQKNQKYACVCSSRRSDFFRPAASPGQGSCVWGITGPCLASDYRRGVCSVSIKESILRRNPFWRVGNYVRSVFRINDTEVRLKF